MEYLLNVGGWEGSNIAHAGLISADQQEEVSGTCELIAQFHQAGPHAIKAVGPELIYKFLGFLVVHLHVETLTDNILTGQLDNPSGQGAVPPRVKALF